MAAALAGNRRAGAERSRTAASAVAEQLPRILVIEDNADAATGIAKLLSACGFEVQTAPDGKTGISLARSFRPEVVLLDIGLPGMTGYDVVGAFRELPSSAACPDRPLGIRPGSRPHPFPRCGLRAPFRQARGLRRPQGSASPGAILEYDNMNPGRPGEACAA